MPPGPGFATVVSLHWGGAGTSSPALRNPSISRSVYSESHHFSRSLRSFRNRERQRRVDQLFVLTVVMLSAVVRSISRRLGSMPALVGLRGIVTVIVCCPERMRCFRA